MTPQVSLECSVLYSDTVLVGKCTTCVLQYSCSRLFVGFFTVVKRDYGLGDENMGVHAKVKVLMLRVGANMAIRTN